MGRYFGTDGFRGEANNNLTADHAYKIGRFLGWYYGEVKRRNGDDTPARIVIGKDTRRSSYMFEYTLVGGLVASGADAYLLHVTTTPSVAYVARTDGFDCGIMISASHNPYYDNGIKLINGNGEKMDEGTIALVEDYLDGKLEVFGENYEEIPFAHTSKIGRTVDYVSGRNRYIGYLISLGLYSFKGVKVGLDCANGSSWNLAKSVFDALGAKTYVINAEPDGTNINNNAGSTHIGGLQKFVVENGLDVGFAYDGDADRCLCVDEKGNLVENETQEDEVVPAQSQPVLDLSIERLRDFDYLLSNFYIVDSSTMIGPEQLNADALLSENMKIDQSSQGPKILIFHTHSQETFADSIPGDPSTSIVGIGEYLTQLLNAKGIETIHDTGVYDIINGKLDRSNAYENAEASVRPILEANPSVEVAIDLHRDGVAEETHLVTDIGGKQTAKIMFFNGLSRTRTNGDIEYLYNPYIQDNLAFSLQMQLACERMYPGFARHIYLRGYRYNLHLLPKSLLIEAGAQTNTVEEMRNAMEVLAVTLQNVLIG